MFLAGCGARVGDLGLWRLTSGAKAMSKEGRGRRGQPRAGQVHSALVSRKRVGADTLQPQFPCPRSSLRLVSSEEKAVSGRQALGECPGSTLGPLTLWDGWIPVCTAGMTGSLKLPPASWDWGANRGSPAELRNSPCCPQGWAEGCPAPWAPGKVLASAGGWP